MISRLFTGLVKPKINTLGEELAGEIEEVGKEVRKWKKGDFVFGTAGPEFGANAEYISLPQDAVLAIKPHNLSFAEAAASVDGFLTAMPFLRDAGSIKSGQNVLIYGASGSVGSAGVQVAKYFGAHVTAVCSTSNLEMVTSLGADQVIDYTTTDFTKLDQMYDIVFDTVGKVSFGQCKSSLTHDGIFLEAGFSAGILGRMIWTSMFGRKKAKMVATGLRPPGEKLKDLDLLKKLLESGEIRPVLDRIYPLEQIAEAHAYVEKGHKKGNVAIDVIEVR